MRLFAEILEGNNAEKLAEYALHVSRILAYSNPDIRANLDTIDSMGRVIKSSNKDSISLRPTQIITAINIYLFTVKGKFLRPPRHRQSRGRQ